MPDTQQILHNLKFSRLKGITNLQEILFDEKPLTAILGVNGCGKSTILYSLACCYQPIEGSGRENFRFSHFFTPTTDATWAGSKFSMEHTFRREQIEYSRQTSHYSKQADRWAPRYSTRPERNIVFIGIQTCVPAIETENYTSLIKYETTTNNDALSRTILQKVGSIFNRNYTELNALSSAGGKKYAGLAYGEIRYSSLSMGAGEQRVLRIIQLTFNAPKYSLILIDEIDLLLHTDALKRLIQVLNDRAVDKSLQIVFTTHREAILELDSIVSIKHILQTPNKTYCFSNTKPDAIHRLTGVQERPLEIFVEDEMARAIITKELSSLGMQRIASITLFGAATNCFTVAAGLLLSGNLDFSNKVFILDGDVYRTREDRLARVKIALSGTEVGIEQKREVILASIRELTPGPQNTSPEVHLHKMIRALNLPGGDEITKIANEIEAVDDTHSFIGSIVSRLGENRAVGISQIINIASQSPEWPQYVGEISEWLRQRRDAFVEAN
jgi:AAA15 family ATPase/GTPase